MRLLAFLPLLLLAACSPPLPSSGETQIALEQFYLRSHSYEGNERPYVVRCAPITYFRPVHGGAVILFGPVTAEKKATGMYVQMHHNNGTWDLNYEGPIKNLPCEYLPVAMDGMDVASELSNSFGR